MGLEETLEYALHALNPSGLLTARTDVSGVRTEWHLRADGRPSRIARGGREVRITYDPFGRVVLYQRNDGRRIRVEHDDATQRVSYVLPDGQIRFSEHDSEGRTTLVGWLDRDGTPLFTPSRTDYGRDASDPTRVTTPSGQMSEPGFDELGRVSRIQHTIRDRADNFDPVSDLLSDEHREITYRVEDGPHPGIRTLTLPNGATHAVVRDDFGRAVRMQSADTGVSIATYDKRDRLIVRHDEGRSTYIRNDALGRVTEIRYQTKTPADASVQGNPPTAGEPPAQHLRYAYHGARLTGIDSPGERSRFGHDPYGRLVEHQVRLMRPSISGHDPWQADAQDHAITLTTRYVRDELGRVIEIELPEGVKLIHGYDEHGTLDGVWMQAAPVTLWQRLVRWFRPAHGRLPVVTNIDLASSTGIQSYLHGNGLPVRNRFDHAGRLTQREDGPIRTQLSYDVGNRLHTLDLRTSPTGNNAQAGHERLPLRYDMLGHLIAAGGANAVTASERAIDAPDATAPRRFSYDANGNRLTSFSDSVQRRYDYAANSNRLMALDSPAGAVRYHYNRAGEPTRIESPALVRTLHYGPDGQLHQIDDNGQPRARYTYNHARQRTAKTVWSDHHVQTTYYTWHGGLLDAEIDEAGQVQRRYLYFGTQPVAMIDYAERKQPRILAIHVDHLGTPKALSDHRQHVLWQARHDSFGRTTVLATPSQPAVRARGLIGHAHAQTSHAFEFNLRFAGQYEDAETGWHYNWHRYYDPDTGRYLTPDPIGLAGGMNGYGYAGQDPFGAIDAWGLAAYRLGYDDPVMTPDAGAGPWDSVSPTLADYSRKIHMQAALPALSFTYPNAVAHLRHYFGNTGADYVIDFEGLLADPKLDGLTYRAYYNEILDATNFVESLNLRPGECVEITSSRGTQVKTYDSDDWWYAVGTYTAWGKARVSVDEDGRYTMYFEYKFWDRYNWDGDKAVPNPIISGHTITDEFMGRFHLAGLAREFTMTGAVQRTVTWDGGGTVDIRNEW